MMKQEEVIYLKNFKTSRMCMRGITYGCVHGAHQHQSAKESEITYSSSREHLAVNLNHGTNTSLVCRQIPYTAAESPDGNSGTPLRTICKNDQKPMMLPPPFQSNS